MKQDKTLFPRPKDIQQKKTLIGSRRKKRRWNEEGKEALQQQKMTRKRKKSSSSGRRGRRAKKAIKFDLSQQFLRRRTEQVLLLDALAHEVFKTNDTRIGLQMASH